MPSGGPHTDFEGLPLRMSFHCPLPSRLEFSKAQDMAEEFGGKAKMSERIENVGVTVACVHDAARIGAVLKPAALRYDNHRVQWRYPLFQGRK